ncbi:hypothetical protein [Clostridium ganghwense]|uniref:Uncharacterized protein n=1 Tax=Clostridium ganghwense TaxID=312089 RepID=A0ABT4CK40_9CLOT|nr:hypothetical protein [Clostridium ganghwense]MCY6369412.1 hypothetical protein [Clostridium ganghwense]
MNEKFDNIKNIRFMKSVNLKKHVFSGKEDFLDFINNLVQLVGDIEKSEMKIILKNEFGTINLFTFDSLKKYIKKYNNIYSLHIIIIDYKNVKCRKAVEFKFETYETLREKSYLKIYSDQESWILSKEQLVFDKYLPKTNKLSIFVSNKIQYILYLVFSFILIYINGNNKLKINESNNIIHKIYLSIDYFSKWQISDYMAYCFFLIIFSFLGEIIKTVFTPTFMIKNNSKEGIKYRFKQKIKEQYNLIMFIIGIISLVIAIVSFIK